MNDVEREIAAEFNTMRGQILGLIESFGLPERQEAGCKATFKVLSYNAQAKITEATRAA